MRWAVRVDFGKNTAIRRTPYIGLGKSLLAVAPLPPHRGHDRTARCMFYEVPAQSYTSSDLQPEVRSGHGAAVSPVWRRHGVATELPLLWGHDDVVATAYYAW